jgi:cytochrome c oxidase subunit II
MRPVGREPSSTRRGRRVERFLGVGPVVVGVAGQGGRSSTFDAAGEGAEHILVLTWTMIVLGTVVFVGVCALWLHALVRGRGDPDALPVWARRHRLLVIGGVLPTVVVLLLTGLTVTTINAVDAIGERDPVRVRVVGHQFWWEVHYPDEQVTTANEVHLPVGRDVEIELVSDNVIHSFWVPPVGHKIDLIPGEVNRLSLRPTTPGEYRGFCAEYCGIQHTRMLFTAVVLPLDEWEAWLAQRRAAIDRRDDPGDDAGFDAFVAGGCAQCHRIAGTDAQLTVGPDLTHLADRRTIGAGTLDHTRDNLTSWIIDPQQHKPGVFMPPLEGRLDAAEITALVDYLETLE